MIKQSNIQSNQTIWDIANDKYGGFDNILTLIQLNPNYLSIDVNLENFLSVPLVYDDQYYVSNAPQIEISAPKYVNPIRQVTGEENQNIYDLVLMVYGDLNMMYKFIQDNPNISSTNDLNVSGKTFNFDSSLNNNGPLLAAVEKRRYNFASFIDSADSDLYRVTDNYINRITDNLVIRTV